MKRLLRGGRVVDPASGRDGVFDVVIDEGRIVRVGKDLLGPGGVTGALPVAGQSHPARGAAEHRRADDEQQPYPDRDHAVPRAPAAQHGRQTAPR